MLIAIDHGNYAVKTPHFSFISGLTEHTVKPPMAEEVLEYNGKYWSLTGQRLPYMRDKTRDDRYFILSLFAIAKELSAACAGWVFEHMLAGGFRTQIAANIAAGGAVDLSGIAEKYAGFLPASFRASIVAACERSIGAVLADNAVVLADSIVENVLQPLLTPVITLVLFFLFYALLRLLVSMLVTVLGLVNKLPVVGTVNRGLGWLVGGGTALLDIYLVLCVVWGLVVITGGSLSVLNDTVMSGSLYYKVFNLFNPFL